MKFGIHHHWTDQVIFTAEIECAKGAPNSWKLGLAVKVAVSEGARLRGAYLRGADLRGAYLRDADLRDADLRGAYLMGADLMGADLMGADLMGADLRDADLRGAYLMGAYLMGADLMGADLMGADLRDAYLRGAYLRGAYLRGAKNVPRLVDGGVRSDGYGYMLIEHDGEWRVIAGCRNFSMPEARAHWGSPDYRCAKLGAESLAILDHMEGLRDLRWPEAVVVKDEVPA